MNLSLAKHDFHSAGKQPCFQQLLRNCASFLDATPDILSSASIHLQFCKHNILFNFQVLTNM